MKKVLSSFICIKNCVIWTVISLCCVLAIGVFVKNTVEGMSAGEDLFLPGILILTLAVVALLIFGITRVIKYVRLLKK
jgi:hypothetical protein